MQRRKFLTLGAVAAASTVVAPALQAVDHRKEQPDAWKVKNVKAGDIQGVNDALKALYGTNNVEWGKNVKIKAPKVASNGGAVPVDFESKVDCESITLLQDVNPESLVAVFDQNEMTIPKYSVKVKLKQSGSVYAVIKAKDGKLYGAKQSLEVALGGCEG